jgi:hypothetical protein
MKKENTKDEVFSCPVGRLFSDFEKAMGKNSDFLDHFMKSHVEFLKAVRSLLDNRIERMDEKRPGKKEKKATKIKVE